jgi:hypothetical protein
LIVLTRFENETDNKFQVRQANGRGKMASSAYAAYAHANELTEIQKNNKD